MKKKIVSLLLCMSMAASMLAGCGSKTVDATNNQVEVVNAYKEFYHTFYEEHLTSQDMGNGYNLNMMDCAAKLIMDGSGNLYLVIADMVSWGTDGNALLDLHIYDYKNQEVTRKVKIPNIKAWDDGIAVTTVGDNIYVCSQWYDYNGRSDEVLLLVKDNEYQELKNTDGGDSLVLTQLGELGIDAGWLNFYRYSLVNMLFSDSSERVCVQGESFEDWLTYYAEHIVNSSLRLDILYANYLVDNRYYDDDVPLTDYIQYWKDGIYYYYLPAGATYEYDYEEAYPASTEDCLYIRWANHNEFVDYTYLNENTINNIPEEIDGIKVVVTDEAKERISERLENKQWWKEVYMSYFKDNYETIVYYTVKEIDMLEAPLVVCVTDDNEIVYKFHYIDGSGEVQELLNCSGYADVCLYSGASINGVTYDEELMSIWLDSEEVVYHYDDSVGKFIEVDRVDEVESYQNREYWYDLAESEQDFEIRPISGLICEIYNYVHVEPDEDFEDFEG